MRPTNRLTPYPVLTEYRDDYLEASFNVDVGAVQKFNSVQLSLVFHLNEPTLAELIDGGDAEFACHIECPLTSYRQCAHTNSEHYEATLGRLEVRDYIEVCTFIVANRPIREFRSPNFHPDYGDMAFDVDEGAVLAIGESKQIAIKSEDTLAHRSSIINVTRADQTDAMAVNTDEPDCVLVGLRPDLYEVYAEQGGGPNSDLILSLVILPALQAVLDRMAADGEDGPDSDKEWFKSIVDILEGSGISISEIDYANPEKTPLAIAQQMLDQPLIRSLSSLAREA